MCFQASRNHQRVRTAHIATKKKTKKNEVEENCGQEGGADEENN
jgi:hypothetical protein